MNQKFSYDLTLFFEAVLCWMVIQIIRVLTFIKIPIIKRSQNVDRHEERRRLDGQFTETSSNTNGHTHSLWVHDPVQRIKTLGEIRPEN